MTSTSRQAKIDLFAQAIVNGNTQAEAYRIAYPVSTKWKADSVHHKASEMGRDVQVLSRIDQLRKQITKEFVWQRVMSLKVLAKVATELSSKNSDKIAAVKELNVMHGYNAPTKLDLSSTDGTMSPNTVDVSKLSENTMKELLEAKTPNV